MGIATRDRCRGNLWRRQWPASARLCLALLAAVVLGAALSTPPARTADTVSSHGRWQAWVADERTCPGGTSTTAPYRAQAMTMLCLVNHARARQGLRTLRPTRILSASAVAKASDIARCHDFRHDACGKRASRAARALGYHGPWGENLYLGKGHLASPRAALQGWLNSAGHRINLFRPQLRTTGIAVLSNATASRDGRRVSNGVIWVHQFGV